MSSYVQVPTRSGIDGAKDKAAIIYSQASWVARTNRDFLNRVRQIINGCNSAEEQVDRWFKYCSDRTYSREYGDIFANPKDSIDTGGDCDDLTILLLAGIMCMGIPCCPDVVIRNGNGVHVRVRVGFPPHNPPDDITKWKILDPSRDSEGRWIGQHGSLYEPKTISKQFGSANPFGQIASVNGLYGNSDQKFSMGLESAIAIGLVAFAGFYIKTMLGGARK